MYATYVYRSLKRKMLIPKKFEFFTDPQIIEIHLIRITILLTKLFAPNMI